MSVVRLNLGCGAHTRRGWINADARAPAGVDVRCDLRGRLPIGDERIDCIVAMHVLQDLAWPELPSAAAELRRVLKRDGVLRLGLPDLARAIQAYCNGDSRYFYVPDDDARCIGAKLVTQIIWYGSVRTPFTFDFAAELLGNAGFARVVRCAFGETHSEHPDIVQLDNRERETLFVEAFREAAPGASPRPG
jgi:hypothetical protein